MIKCFVLLFVFVLLFLGVVFVDIVVVLEMKKIVDVGDVGYYVIGCVIGVFDNVVNMELMSLCVVSCVGGFEIGLNVIGLFGFGYQFGNGWCVEGEYVFKCINNFISYWVLFDVNVNEFYVLVQWLMLNGYKDFDFGCGFFVYGMFGIGVVIVLVDGWQINDMCCFVLKM